MVPPLPLLPKRGVGRTCSLGAWCGAEASGQVLVQLVRILSWSKTLLWCVCVCVCVCVYVSIFSILPSRAFRHPTRGIGGYSAENAVK